MPNVERSKQISNHREGRGLGSRKIHVKVDKQNRHKD